MMKPHRASKDSTGYGVHTNQLLRVKEYSKSATVADGILRVMIAAATLLRRHALL